MGRTITRADFWKLVGLKALADDLSRQLMAAAAAARSITGEAAEDHTDDFIFGAYPDQSAGQLLAKLEIIVEEATCPDQ